MSKMPPTCTDCHDADATNADGWCDECAAMRDDDPNSPSPRPSHGWTLAAVRAHYPAPMPVQVPFPAPVPGPSDTEPRYRFPF